MNYTDLLADVADWLNREDLSTRIPRFVEMFESRANKALRVADMEITAFANLVGGAVPLPADFLEPRRIWSDAAGTAAVDLIQLSPGMAAARFLTSQSGVSTHYSISGSTLTTYPNGGTGRINMIYYAALPPLRQYGQNWLLTKWPDLYIYGSLVEAAPYVDRDDTRLQTWTALYQKAQAELQGADQRSRYAGAVCRVAGVLP